MKSRSARAGLGSLPPAVTVNLATRRGVAAADGILAADAVGELHVLDHDGDATGVDGTEVGILVCGGGGKRGTRV